MILQIDFDGYWLDEGPPSGRNVVLGIISTWARLHPEDDLTLTVRAAPQRELHPGLKIRVVRPIMPIHGIWVLTQFARRSHSRGSDLSRNSWTLSQNFTPLLSPRRRRSAIFLHDVLFLTNPEWFTKFENLYMRFAMLTNRAASLVLTSSRSEASRISTAAPNLRKAVEAVGLSVPLDLLESEPARPERISSSDRFILAVGRLNVRKNLSRLIDAFLAAELPAGYKLVIIGPDERANEVKLSTSLPHPRIVIAGRLTDGEIGWAYRNCEFFVFPSLDEGFGLPMIEAKHYGAEVLASDIPVFRELGIAAAFFDPYDVAEITRCIERAVRSPAVLDRKSADRELGWEDVVDSIREHMISRST